MEEQPQSGSRVGDSMMFGLIEHAERIEESMAETQRVLAERIKELTQVKAWAVQASVDLQKRADTAIKNLETERSKLQQASVSLDQNAQWAIREAVRSQSGDIERQTVQAFAAPLHDIQQAAAQVRQNVKEMKWFTIALMVATGLILGLMLGYWPMRSSQNNMQEQVNRIEQYLAAQQPAAPAPVAPDPHASTRKGKAK